MNRSKALVPVNFHGVFHELEIGEKTSNSGIYNVSGIGKSIFNVLIYIEQNLKDKISLDLLAGVSNLSKFEFSRRFKYQIGTSPMMYVQKMKILSARDQIFSDTNITQLAYEYNFTDISHFSKYFKKHIGVSPMKYKLKLKKV